jgi:uncharacterized small protein (TIGR04563 family)
VASGRRAKEVAPVVTSRIHAGCRMVERHKVSIWFNNDLLEQLREEAQRTERSYSWIVQRCVRRNMQQIREMVGPPAEDREAE